MNWHMIISGLIVVVLKVVGMTFFLLYFPQIFGQGSEHIIPTESYGTVPKMFTGRSASTESSGTVCPRGWNLHQGRCFFLSSSELPWNRSKSNCEAEGATLAIVNTPEKLEFLKNIASAEQHFIGLTYQPEEKKWRWINNSKFNGNVTNYSQNFNCVTIGLTDTFDAALCDINYRWICEKSAK
ncbi:C-type lectin domain family 5 member A [Echinops telfairi]|uniref:C-type lectin domain family 5 member A n=1 Tax=Echinops telfairi TaxID=9371 RepID=A0AC55CZ97_ECHTE|nr:C-type lectin domain family 5 member A [Echinops telfairi]